MTVGGPRPRLLAGVGGICAVVVQLYRNRWTPDPQISIQQDSVAYKPTVTVTFSQVCVSESFACKYGRRSVGCQSINLKSHQPSGNQVHTLRDDGHRIMPARRVRGWCSFASRLGEQAEGAREKAIEHALSQMDVRVR